MTVRTCLGLLNTARSHCSAGSVARELTQRLRGLPSNAAYGPAPGTTTPKLSAYPWADDAVRLSSPSYCATTCSCPDTVG